MLCNVKSFIAGLIVWLLFIIISNLTNPLSMLLHAIFTLPFFVLALLSRKWPRITGVCLLIAAGFFFYRFGLYKIFGDQPFERGRGAVIVFFLGPLAGSGIALLCKDNAATDEQDEKK